MDISRCFFHFRATGAMLPECSFDAQVGEGAWGQGELHHAFTPRGCRLRAPLSASHLRRCLRNKTLSFAGDSVVRELALAMASLLSNASSQTAGWQLHPGLDTPKHDAPERIARQCLSDEKARAEVRGASLR